MPASDPPVPRVFIASAPHDLKYAEVIVAKARADRLPVAFDQFPDGRPSDVSWKLECRRRIRSAGAMLVLVSPHTSQSTRALWQVQCARELGVPVVGVTVSFDDEAERERGAAVGADALVGWKWKTIAATVVRLATPLVPPFASASQASGDGAGGANRQSSLVLSAPASAA